MKWDHIGTVRPATGGKKVRIKIPHAYTMLTDLEMERAGHIVGTSRTIVEQVIGMLMWPNAGDLLVLNQLGVRYFKTPKSGLTPSQKALVASKLRKVLTGISGTVSFKVGLGAGAQDANGYVRSKFGAEGLAAGLFSPSHTLGTRKGELVARGDIHLDKDRLNHERQHGIITFIHEATHKYASTLDHGLEGYLDASGLKYSRAGLSMDEALDNADSYAFFCYVAYFRPKLS